MRTAKVLVHGELAGILTEVEPRRTFRFQYETGYSGPPVSLTMPVRGAPWEFAEFPPFFDGLLPEGAQLEALLAQSKIDRRDHFSQLVAVGGDLVGAVTVEDLPDEVDG
ncbi:MAG: HipA N-terminal domain-containing protein [Planctomycetes bacterium]|nr:HipA N-terminal domain-containing protein [Planctomycetota bacterium]